MGWMRLSELREACKRFFSDPLRLVHLTPTRRPPNNQCLTVAQPSVLSRFYGTEGFSLKAVAHQPPGPVEATAVEAPNQHFFLMTGGLTATA